MIVNRYNNGVSEYEYIVACSIPTLVPAWIFIGDTKFCIHPSSFRIR